MRSAVKAVFSKKKGTKDKVESSKDVDTKVSQDDFEIITLLGKGAFGRVALVRKKDTQEQFAMKVIYKENLLDKGRVQDLFSERSVMRRAKHPFITRLEYAFQSTHKLFFVMEYMPGGDLDHLLKAVPEKRFNEETARFYAAQMFLALQYLHELDIIYRDLKPENILLDTKGFACLADFGLARDFQLDPADVERTTSFVGSPYYVAPDVLRKKGYGMAVDWWSFGVLLFRMLSGTVPFSGRNVRELFHNIIHNEPTLGPYPWVSKVAEDLIMKLLVKDEKKRLNGNAIKTHPFFANVNWDKIYSKETGPPQAFHAPTRRNSAPEQVDDLSASPPTTINVNQQALFQGFTYAQTPSLVSTALDVRDRSASGRRSSF